HRIELEEIEAQLARHPGVRACAVRAIGDRHDKRLVAYVVPADAAESGKLPAGVRDYLAQCLPDYMVPRAVVLLDALPLTSNGKLDAAALPAPAAEAAASSEAPAPVSGARAELERTILQVWEEILGRTPISPTANFFDLGGDSLRMVRVRRALFEKLSRELTMVELYAHPSPRQLATQLARADAPAASAAPVHAGQSRAARRRRALSGTEGAA
ncbi:MAG TPA: phosphopantetheine-binding protein, partial [Polyangiales bacterium]|nr:phosphopantetheine-binding protein [Polyangiales bacterium]